MACTGLRADAYSIVKIYLNRTGVTGGGSISVSGIAKEMFKKSYSNLSKTQKRQVDDMQAQRQLWRNDHYRMTVHSTKCKQFVNLEKNTALKGDDLQRSTAACKECLQLLKNKSFKNATKRHIPSDEKRKYTPKKFCPRGLAENFFTIVGLRHVMEAASNDGKTPCLRFAEGVLKGEFKKDEAFVGFVEATMIMKDKEARGVG